MNQQIKYKKTAIISFILGFFVGVLYFIILITREMKNYSSLRISENIGFIVVISLINGIIYSLISSLFTYLKIKCVNKKFIPLLIVILIVLVIYIPLVIFLTIGFLIGITGF